MGKITIIEKCSNCGFYNLYSEFYNPIKPVNHLISVCTKGNFIINGHKELDEIDELGQEIPENCPLENYAPD
jgi:hypothetical protein